MKTDFETGKQEKNDYKIYYIPGLWISFIIQVITGGVTTAITLVVTILILLGGLWLAYIYLPVKIFYIVIVVLIIDVVIGFILRAVLERR